MPVLLQFHAWVLKHSRDGSLFIGSYIAESLSGHEEFQLGEIRHVRG